MNAQLKESGEQSSSPRLGLLQLEMSVNATDKQLLSNLEYTKSLNLPKLRFAEPNDRSIAICGSGPSLKKYWSLIPRDCAVMALNGAYEYLKDCGVSVDYFAMLDSRSVNESFLRDLNPHTLHLLASQCAPNCFAVLARNGCRHGVFHLSTPTTMKVFPDEELYVAGGGTIGLTSIGIAIALGYRNLKLFGFDSSFDKEDRHVSFQPQNQNESTLPVWVEDRAYMTSHAMAAQVMDFFPLYETVRREFPDVTIDISGEGLFYDFIKTNNSATTREKELAKYVSAYEEENYGMSQGRYEGVKELLTDIPNRGKYLDVSCGRGESLHIAKELGYEIVSGTETVDSLIDGVDIGYGILPNISKPDKYYDVVSLFEVIEHLVPEDVEPALHELTRLAKHHILISAAVYPHWMGGVNLHPSARPFEEWGALFSKVWGSKVYRVRNLGSSPAWRVDLSAAS